MPTIAPTSVLTGADQSTKLNPSGAPASRANRLAGRAVIVHSWLMLTAVPRMLLTSLPRAGKTALVGRLADELPAVGVAVGGFLTREIREDGETVGFTVEEIGGSRALLAHVALPQRPHCRSLPCRRRRV